MRKVSWMLTSSDKIITFKSGYITMTKELIMSVESKINMV